MAMRSGLCGVGRFGSHASSSSLRRTSAPRRSCLARIAATSTNRNRLSIGAAFGRSTPSSSATSTMSSVFSIMSTQPNTKTSGLRLQAQGCARREARQPRARLPGPEAVWSTTPASAGDFDVDRAGLRLFPERQLHREHAVLEVRADLARIDGVGQRERPVERAVRPLDPAVALFLHLRVELLVALQDEGAVLDADLDVLAADAGQLGAHHQVMVVGLEDVHCRDPGTAECRVLVPQVDIAKQAVHPILHGGELTDGIDFGDGHTTTSPSFTSWSLCGDEAEACAASACDCL